MLRDACSGRVAGAEEVVRFCLMLRGNPRSRRTFESVRGQWRQLHGRRNAQPPKWYTDLASHVYGMWRQWRTYGFPTLAKATENRLEESLSRATRRVLKYTGAVQAELPTLEKQAKEASQSLWGDLQGQQLLVWVDNWYCERFGVNPQRPVNSTDLTAMAVLPLSSADDRPADRTRSHSLPTQSYL